MTTHTQEFVSLLIEARQLLSLPSNCFDWSSWDSAADAVQELDGLIKQVSAGEIPQRKTLELLFSIAGPIQEVSLSSGWAERFLDLANRFDASLERLYANGT